MEAKICQCCGMPLTNDVMSKNLDGTTNIEYCKWCYVDGKFTYHNIDELIDACIPFMVEQGFNILEARHYMKENLPKLKYWQNNKNL